MAKQVMSMEAMLDEERREVLALLEGTQHQPRPQGPGSIDGRSPSPFTSPRSPVRSMLDYGDDSPSPALSTSQSNTSAKTLPRLAPVRSMLDVDSPPPATAPIRSMLDVGDSPPPSTAKKVFSSPSSPVESSSRHSTSRGPHPRSLSDAASRPADFGPRSSASRLDPTSNYQFADILTNNTGNAKPKRVTQGGKQGSKRSSMAEVMRGNDVQNLILPGDRGRHFAAGGNPLRLNSKDKSKSPNNRGLRSNSPGNMLQGRQMSPGARAALGEPLDIDINNAYRRLSDAALARSGGSLSTFGRRKGSDKGAGDGRLNKDYLTPEGELIEDSSEENASSSEDERERGRKPARTFGKANPKGTSGGSNSPETPRTARSLLAAAEEERTFDVALLIYSYANLRNRSPRCRSAARVPIQVTARGAPDQNHCSRRRAD